MTLRKTAITSVTTIASVAAFFALGMPAGHAAEGSAANRSSSVVQVEHVKIHSDRPYAEVKAAIERRLGRLDEPIRALLAQGKTEELRTALEKVAGKDGLVIHYMALHGDLLVLNGGKRPGIVYYVGNVLSAVQMTRQDFGAGLYAPLKLAVYDDGHGTSFEFDRPTTLFGQFKDDKIDAVAKSLDERLYALVDKVSQPDVNQ